MQVDAGGNGMETAAKRGYTMAEACEYLGGISRPTMYRLLGQGEIDSYHLGVRRSFTRESLDRLINSRMGLWPEVEEMVDNDRSGGGSDPLR